MFRGRTLDQEEGLRKSKKKQGKGRDMHLKKRKIVIDVLRKVMYSDGEVDIAETEFLMRVGTAINVDLH